MKKTMKYILMGIVAVSIVATSIVYMTMPLTVAMTEVRPKIAEVYFIEQGVVEVDDNLIQIFSPISGKVLETHVEENDKLTKGDLIAVIDAKEYEYQILQNESTIKSYEAQIQNLSSEERARRDSLVANRDSLQAELRALTAQENQTTNQTSISKDEQLRLQRMIISQCEEDLQYASDNFEKIELLYNQGAASKNMYDEAKKMVENLHNLLDQNILQLEIIEKEGDTNQSDYYEAMKESLEAQIQGLNSNINSSSIHMTDYYRALIEGLKTSNNLLGEKIAEARIVATHDGIIKNLVVNETNIVMPQSPIAEISREGVQNIVAYISTKDIEEISLNDLVELTFRKRSGDIKFAGRIIEIDNEAIARMSSLGIEERKVKIKIAAEQTNEIELKTGYDVDVKFTIYREESQLLLPKTAVFKVNNADVVWLVRDGIANLKTVETGIETRAEVLIESGLAAGDVVISNANISGLKEGARVANE